MGEQVIYMMHARCLRRSAGNRAGLG